MRKLHSSTRHYILSPVLSSSTPFTLINQFYFTEWKVVYSHYHRAKLISISWALINCPVLYLLSCFPSNSTTSYVLVEEHHNWSSAQAYCREHHRDLVSIRSREENNYVQLTLKNALQVTSAWIGLYREPWAFWSDNSNSTYTNWEPTQPNNYNSEQHCGSLSVISGKWGDDHCWNRMTFFCLAGEA
uniref:C-type lectin domain-containing protein n=1 Tax=Seriola dumerili TaxID=41447 RepID=A0A3B4T715_SERDU